MPSLLPRDIRCLLYFTTITDGLVADDVGSTGASEEAEHLNGGVRERILQAIGERHLDVSVRAQQLHEELTHYLARRQSVTALHSVCILTSQPNICI